MMPVVTLSSRRARVWAAYAVHALTASGVLLAFAAVAEISLPSPDPRWVFLWLLLAGLVDAIDGPLARRLQVKTYAPRIQGRVLDDIIDFLTFSFIPLLLVWRMDWLAGPDLLWIAPALITSLLGFANTGAKQEELGFFGGFPSYWNLVAYFIGWLAVAYAPAGRFIGVAVVLLFALLTVAPLRFIYPNQAPRPWRAVVLIGAFLWLALLIATLPAYPHLPSWAPRSWLIAGLIGYPAFYFLLSFVLDWRARRAGRG